MTKTYCDRCQWEIEKGTPTTSVVMIRSGDREYLELCEQCFCELRDFIRVTERA